MWWTLLGFKPKIENSGNSSLIISMWTTLAKPKFQGPPTNVKNKKRCNTTYNAISTTTLQHTRSSNSQPLSGHCVIHHRNPSLIPLFSQSLTVVLSLDYLSDSDICLFGYNGVDFSIPPHFLSTFRPVGSRVNWRRKEPNRKS